MEAALSTLSSSDDSTVRLQSLDKLLAFSGSILASFARRGLCAALTPCLHASAPPEIFCKAVQVLDAALRGMAPSDAAAAARGILGAPPQVAESMLECACLAIREQLAQPFTPQQPPVAADDPRWEPLGKMLLSLTELVPKAVDITLPELRRNAPLSPLVPPINSGPEARK